MSDIKQLVDVVESWHGRNMATLQTIIETPQATEIRLGDGDDAIVLTGDQAKGFRTAAVVFKGLFEKLPFSIEKTDPIQEKVTGVVIDVLGNSGDEPMPLSFDLYKDGYAEDFDLHEVLDRLSDEFGVQISGSFEEISTIGGLVGIVRKAVAAECGTCKQSDVGQTGEYPCTDCGLPTTHDA